MLSRNEFGVINPDQRRHQKLKRNRATNRSDSSTSASSNKHVIDLTGDDDDAMTTDVIVDLTKDDTGAAGLTKKKVGAVLRALVSHLQLFAAFRDPASLPRQQQLHTLYLELLCHENAQIQKVRLPS